MTEHDSASAGKTFNLKQTLLGGHGFPDVGGLGSAHPDPHSVVTDVEGQGHRDESKVSVWPFDSSARRTTVLPHRKRDDAAVSPEARPRYQRVKTLGEGAMGSVELVRDNDIRRTVALKRLKAGSGTPSALSRFADEVRVVGQLEHPGIVPIYDVDRGDDGELYLVMKHLQGETMEQVIDRLRAGDDAYAQRFTTEYRVRIFLGVLDAIGYAHARGVLHRDLKPANIMIGPYGEVTVVDWGIAKPLPASAGGSQTDCMATTLLTSHDSRLLETQMGTLAGTPLYMSPEQAASQNDELDERSDVYTLCVVLYEWLVLRHPLQHLQSLHEVLATLVLNDYTFEQLFHPAQQAGVPMEYIWAIRRGLVRDRSKRYQTVSELSAAVKAIQNGEIVAQCPITFTKRHTQKGLQWIDRNPKLFTRLVRFAGTLLVALVLVTAALGCWLLTR